MATSSVSLLAPPEPELPRNCTFDGGDWAILAQHWYPIALARDVGDKPLSTKLLDEPLVIYRAGAELVVARDICPHRGVPLSMGTQVEGGVTCAYHGLRFGAGGAATMSRPILIAIFPRVSTSNPIPMSSATA